MKTTVSDIAETIGCDKDTAYSLVKFLANVGLAEVCGARRPESGRGKGENVYEISAEAPALVAEIVEKIVE